MSWQPRPHDGRYGSFAKLMMIEDWVYEYNEKNPIGQGTYGLVYKCVKTSNDARLALYPHYASLPQHAMVKKGRTEHREGDKKQGQPMDTTQDTLNEAMVDTYMKHGLSAHPNIVKILGFEVDLPKLYMVQYDYSLDGLIGDISAAFTAFRSFPKHSFPLTINLMDGTKLTFDLTFRHILGIIYDILDALSYCHARQVTHNDVKPGNVLLTFTNIRMPTSVNIAASITDFGSTTIGAFVQGMGSVADNVVRAIKEKSPRGAASFQYLNANEPIHNPACDIYSVGILIACLLSGRNDIRLKREPSAMQWIRNMCEKPPPPRGQRRGDGETIVVWDVNHLFPTVDDALGCLLQVVRACVDYDELDTMYTSVNQIRDVISKLLCSMTVP